MLLYSLWCTTSMVKKKKKKNASCTNQVAYLKTANRLPETEITDKGDLILVPRLNLEIYMATPDQLLASSNRKKIGSEYFHLREQSGLKHCCSFFPAFFINIQPRFHSCSKNDFRVFLMYKIIGGGGGKVKFLENWKILDLTGFIKK